MLDIYLSIPVLLFLSVLQISIVSRIQLINGAADIILLSIAAWGIHDRNRSVYFWALIGGLFISITSSMPLFTPIVPYLAVAILTQVFQTRVWQAPLISVVIVVLLGTFFQHLFGLFVLLVDGLELDWTMALQYVTLPTIFLNLLFLIPVQIFFNDLRKWITREQLYD